MFTDSWTPSKRLTFWVGVGGVVVGTVAGVLAGAMPLYLSLALGAVLVVVYFFADFERAVMGLLILRSSLDVYSEQQIPALFAIGVDALALLYVTVLLLTNRTVRTDWFWWFFAGWVMLQGLWPILCVLGGLELGTSALLDNIREWTRIFSWMMFYLLVMQLKDRLHPEKIIYLLFISLIPPVVAALMQAFLPESLLPSLLALYQENRVRGTFGHSNAFSIYLLLFMGLTWWKLSWARKRWPWWLLLFLLASVYAGTHALVSLAMLGVFILVMIAPKLNLRNVISAGILVMVVVGLFASTEFGRDRLDMLAGTPLFNPNIDVSRAILLSQSDYNSFNWRLTQWYYLLQAWQQSPFLGCGLGTAPTIGPFYFHAHNDYIRALVEGGILGLATFLAFLSAQGVRLVQLIHRAPHGSAQRDLCLILLAIFISTLVAMFTDNVWDATTFYFYLWTMLAIAGWNWNDLQPSESFASISPVSRLPR